MNNFTKFYKYLTNKNLVSKQTLFFLMLCPILAFSQWNQIGSIDGNTTQSRFGFATSIDSSGDIVAIGAPLDNFAANQAGSVRVFQNNSGMWNQVGSSIFGLGVAGEQFGGSVSLNSPGDIVAVGQFNTANGTVRVYQNISNVWTQIGSDIIGETNNDGFAHSVSLSAAGDVLAVGARLNDGNGTNSGHVRVYLFFGNSWIQVGQDIDGEAANDFSGESVSLNETGTIVAIGAIQNNGGFGHTRVYEYIIASNMWIQMGADIDGTTVSAFGTSVDLSDSGNILAVGAPTKNITGQKDGQVKVYEFISNTWTQIGQNLNGTFERDEFGTSVSLSSAGDVLAVGSPATLFGHIDNIGTARVYKNISGTWTQINQDITAGASVETGRSVSLNSNGLIICVGLPKGASAQGRARIYENTNVLSISYNSFDAEISMFPNPSSSETTIKIGNRQQKVRVSVTTILGKTIETFTVENTNEFKLQTLEYASGIYIVNLQSGNQTASLKLVIK